MFKLGLLAFAMSVGLSACTSNQYLKPHNLRFQKHTLEHTQVIQVTRDNKLCPGDIAHAQNCPIHFYIDNIEAGQFYINNSSKYFLKKDVYNFKVKNCTSATGCQSCDVDLRPDQLKSHDFHLSVSDDGKPIISNDTQSMVCRVEGETKKPITTNVPKTLTINLSADTLFKFDGSSLNDLLPKGRHEVQDVALKIANGFVSVNQIKLVGHTDRLGSDDYNQKLGQSRAETIRQLLIQYGVSEKIISASSVGESQPVTNGCHENISRDELKACLQPDRRVTVEITGITK